MANQRPREHRDSQSEEGDHLRGEDTRVMRTLVISCDAVNSKLPSLHIYLASGLAEQNFHFIKIYPQCE